MPYLGLTGTRLVVAITISSGMGFIMFGRFYLSKI